MSDHLSTSHHLASCTLCPRACRVNRTTGQLGYCRAGATLRIFRHGPHFGEEPPISGTHGSGTLFFSHCTLRCIYCQNHPWSQSANGEIFTTAELTNCMASLAKQGCHNWNLVSPTPWLLQIRKAAFALFRAGINLPFVYNTSGFETLDTLAEFRELIDIALVDLRYANSTSAADGSDAPGYVTTARQAIQWFWDQLGPLETNGDDVAVKGVICRLLVLPGRSSEVIENLEWLAANIGTDVHISVMSQYTPVHRALTTPGWDRTVTRQEYQSVTEAAAYLGFANGWIQEFEEVMPPDLLGQEMPAGAGSVGVNRGHPQE